MKMASVHTTGLSEEGVHGVKAVVRELVSQVVEQRADLGWDLHINQNTRVSRAFLAAVKTMK